MLKCIGYFAYLLSMLTFYAFFGLLTAGHFIAYFEGSSQDCYAYSDKSLLEAYPTGGDNLHNVLTNFNLVNMWGGITFGLTTLLLLTYQVSLWRDSYYRSDNWSVCPGMTLGASWFGYFLCLMSVRLRHAGKVCSGDFLPNRLLFGENTPPYLHNQGLFLWYAIVAQWGFFIVMISGAISIVD